MVAFPLAVAAAAAAVAVDAAVPAAPVPPAAAGVAARSRSPAAAGRCPSSPPDGGSDYYGLLSSDRLTETKKVGTLIVGSALHCYPLTVTATLPPLEF